MKRKNNPARYCEHEGCAKPYWSAGLCQMHHSRRRRGQPLDPPAKRAPHGSFTHGTAFGGVTKKCQCGPCRRAARELWSANGKQQRAKAKQTPPEVESSTHGIWTDRGTTVTLCWPPRNAGSDWRCTCGRSRA